MCSIGVVIPVHNQAFALSMTLSGFTRQHPSFRQCPIIVVDDGSTEPIKAVVEAYMDMLNLIYVQQEQRGRAAARNKGVRHLGTDYVIFCDADRVPRPEFIKVHYEMHRKSDEPHICVGQVRELFIAEPEMNRDRVLHSLLKEQSDRVPQFCRLVYKLFGPDGTSQSNVPWIATLSGNLSVPAKLVKDLSGFDELFREWGFEHMEFGYRAYQRGIHFRYLHGAINVHLAHPRQSGAYESAIRVSHHYFFKKHPQPVIEKFLDFMLGQITLRQLEIISSNHTNFIGTDSLAPDEYVRITNFKKTLD